jgi:hypothetical protein
MEPFDFQKVELFCQVTVEPFNLRLERHSLFFTQNDAGQEGCCSRRRCQGAERPLQVSEKVV